MSPETAFLLRVTWPAVRFSCQLTGPLPRRYDKGRTEIADLFDLAPGQPERPEIPKDEVVLRAGRLERVAMVDEPLGQRLRVLNDGLGVRLEARVGRLLEGDGDAGNRVVVRATLAGGENGVVDPRLEVGFLVFAEEDEAGPGTTEGLVGRRGHDVAVLERVVLGLAGDQARDVGHLRALRRISLCR